MRVSRSSRHALTACALATVLSGSNSGGLQFSPSSMQQNAARSGLNTDASSAKLDASSLSGEVLTANKVSVGLLNAARRVPS
jgi:hypothetical protein